MGELIAFTFDNKDVRIIDSDGQPWFVLADVCQALNLSKHKGSFAHHAEKLDDDEKATIPREAISGTPTLNMGVVAQEFIKMGGGKAVWADPSVWVVSESGLYTIILRHRDATKPGTLQHRFRKWVTAEVLPTIRRTGRYKMTAGSTANNGDEAATIAALQDRMALLEELLELHKRDGRRRNADAHTSIAVRIIQKTDLDDNEIAEILAPAIGMMPEWVAFQRRRYFT